MAEVTIEKSAINFRHNRLPANFKILVVGSNHKAAMEQYYLRYLKELGVKIDIFPAQGIFYAYYNASFLNKLSFKLGLSRIYKIINARLLAQIKNDKPDLLFVFKGMEIFPATLARIKKMGIKLVNYNPDSPFVFSGPGSGNKNVRQAISLFDLYLTYDRGIQWQLQERKVKSVVIPFGFDISEEEVRICAAEPEILRVCFLGNPDKERADFLNRLAETQVPIDVYGVGWDRFQLHGRIKAHGPVYELEYWKVLRKYRVQLNLMRPHNPHSHNMRSLEIPGV